MCMFCRSLFVLLYFFFWPLCCMFFFDIRILITLLVSSNSSCMKFQNLNLIWSHMYWTYCLDLIKLVIRRITHRRQIFHQCKIKGGIFVEDFTYIYTIYLIQIKWTSILGTEFCFSLSETKFDHDGHVFFWQIKTIWVISLHHFVQSY